METNQVTTAQSLQLKKNLLLLVSIRSLKLSQLLKRKKKRKQRKLILKLSYNVLIQTLLKVLPLLLYTV